MFAFRINSKQGIGHFMRCKWLALALQQRGHEIFFFLDKNPTIEVLANQLSWPVVYFPALSQQQDAQQVLSAMALKAERFRIIVDNYELGVEWERVIKAANVELIVIDDMAREHLCDYLIDQKYTADMHTRYQHKVPADCQLILGPKYALLDPQYQNVESHQALPKKNIMFSLGGGGDWQLLSGLIEQLATFLDNAVTITVVLGPQATNKNSVLSLVDRFTQIKVVDSPNSLLPLYKKAHLFVGALGTSLYELMATHTPALTFAIANNQQNMSEDLEQLGHFFHIEHLLSLSVERQIKLIETLLSNHKRITKLTSCAPYKVDGLGVERVVDILLGTHSLNESERHAEVVSSNQQIIITHDLSYRPVQDSDMMAYLRARNKPSNASKMTISNAIKIDEHICWWFNNRRQSFVIYKAAQPIVFIWHQELELQQQQFIIGGWFTIDDDVSFPEALMILKWQLKFTQKVAPEARWIAVIHKENKFVRLLNQYMGFEDVSAQSLSHKAIEFAFPHATPQYFYYIDRAPHKQVK
ncbi:UDP-2,4-diacetamido-2,4,6-trideoxy-beta-L-altropyranose hydrolase [Pseudoalteromonas sp. JBTF-M23]|uniref:UDP-2,4-diacetamido-2,4, 6-trideoxy-beta-L-altropyranose hydrolase n=1 Tax=Pseudoalteromonas caenipelagi TaxID=2726988 RepID=A0A849VBX8_9GAMM|nr:UDP-2,4-diacetamido-2,4,6-trideoxy-beta-L-altropyranose hydrolase [Pseudoalteromonas caenipelagi]NOU50786.1 UDP-2,4-diacetamido-2,4,6-trideoxy-beta-L-altropyranose hydrolase [Pseudoalteromonas caenipelagi]